MNFLIELTVTPRPGVRDPQAEAVEEALHGAGFAAAAARCVGRLLILSVASDSLSAACAQVDQMCRTLLVNPNLETYTLTAREAPAGGRA